MFSKLVSCAEVPYPFPSHSADTKCDTEGEKKCEDEPQWKKKEQLELEVFLLLLHFAKVHVEVCLW